MNDIVTPSTQIQGTSQQGQSLDQFDDAGLTSLVNEIRKKHGSALQAILVYGSWLRGKRDTMLDFYVLVENYRTLGSIWQGWLCHVLPPNVYHIHHNSEHVDIRAKYALLTLKHFHHAMEHDFHSYFWARFAQPCKILFARDAEVEACLLEAFSLAAGTFVRRVLPTVPEQFSSEQLWTRGLSLTYRCELRTENSDRANTIYAYNPEYYAVTTRALSCNRAVPAVATGCNVYRNKSSIVARRFSKPSWQLRQFEGKLLSTLRLFKAAFTFNEPLDYLLWKIERHSGLYIEPTQRQRSHPLIFAWPLLWKLYRQGAFR